MPRRRQWLCLRLITVSLPTPYSQPRNCFRCNLPCVLKVNSRPGIISAQPLHSTVYCPGEAASLPIPYSSSLRRQSSSPAIFRSSIFPRAANPCRTGQNTSGDARHVCLASKMSTPGTPYSVPPISTPSVSWRFASQASGEEPGGAWGDGRSRAMNT